MEKYTTWRDKATGIAPFIPVVPVRPTSALVRVSLVAFQTGLFVLKLPVFLVMYALFVAVPFVPVVSQFLARLLLLLFGLYTVDISVEGVKRTNRALTRANHPGENEIVVVNSTSPLDALILSSFTPKPVFAVPDGAGVFRQLSVTGMARYAAAWPHQALTSAPVLDFGRHRGKTVYLFAEGTTSNNKAVLPFPANLQALPKTHKLKSLALRLSPSSLCTPVPVSLSVYLHRILTNVTGIVKGRVVLLDIDVNWVGIRDSFETAGRLRLVGPALGVEGKARFLEAYSARGSKANRSR